MPKAGRLGDTCSGHACFPPSPIIAGSPDVSINGKPAARKGDAVMPHACGCPGGHGVHGRSISAGSSNVSINGKPASRVGDAIGCGGSISAGSGNVFIGDTPYQGETHDCGEDSVQEKATYLKITPLAEAADAVWTCPPFIPEALTKKVKEEEPAVEVGGVSAAAVLKENTVVPDGFDEVYEKASEAKSEIDMIADEIANRNSGIVAKAPIKSRERAIQKIMNDYKGDASQIKDLARNTIIVAPEKIDSVVNELAEKGAKIKNIDAASNALGYSGVNSTIETPAGIVGEIQVNTPAMIYAKESENVARSLLGNKLYDSVAEKSGIPGGMGHKIYEEYRTLKLGDPKAVELAEKSCNYYDLIRNSNGYK